MYFLVLDTFQQRRKKPTLVDSNAPQYNSGRVTCQHYRVGEENVSRFEIILGVEIRPTDTWSLVMNASEIFTIRQFQIIRGELRM